MFMPLGASVLSLKITLLSSRCLSAVTTAHLLDHRHFHVLGVVVVGQIKVLGHGKNLLHDSGNCDYFPPQTEGAHQNGPQVYGWFLQCTACDIAGKGSHRPRRWQYNRTAFWGEHFRPWKLSYQSSPCSYKCDTWVGCMEMFLVVLGLAHGGRQRYYGPRCHGNYFHADGRTRVGC